MLTAGTAASSRETARRKPEGLRLGRTTASRRRRVDSPIALPAEGLTGSIFDFRPVLDESKRTLIARAVLPNPGGKLKSGSFVEGEILKREEEQSLVFLNVRGRDLGGTVEALDKALAEHLELPAGYYYRISGQWENQVRAARTLRFIIPLVLLVILVLLFITFNSLIDALIVMLSIPFALIGGVLLVAHYQFNLSVAVWVGFIALFGVAVNTGVLMVVYLNEAMDRVITEKGSAGVGWPDIIRASYEGSALRLRPKLMTVATSLFGLLPIMWQTGTGSEVMRPIAAPLIGGLISSTVLVLIVLPVVFALARWLELRYKGRLDPRGNTGLSH